MELKTVTQQNTPFILSALPLTMELARLTKAILLTKVKGYPEKWPYEDKILVWLEPAFFGDVSEYHSQTGKGLSDLLMPHQVEHLDQTFLKKLVSQLEEMRPGITKIIT